MTETTASKQEMFAQLVAQGETQAAAYRKSHPAAKKWTNETVWAKASRLAKDVAPRIAELREASTSAAVLSVTEAKEILSKIARNHIDMREKVCDPDGIPVGEKDVPNRDRIAAIDRLSKMQGWDCEQKITVRNGGFSDDYKGPPSLASLTDEQLAAKLKELQSK